MADRRTATASELASELSRLGWEKLHGPARAARTEAARRTMLHNRGFHSQCKASDCLIVRDGDNGGGAAA